MLTFIAGSIGKKGSRATKKEISRSEKINTKVHSLNPYYQPSYHIYCLFIVVNAFIGGRGCPSPAERESKHIESNQEEATHKEGREQ